MEKIVKDFLKEKGYEDTVDETQLNKIAEWLKWYSGKTKDYKYKIYNGTKNVECELKTLNLPSQICNDKSDFIFNEKLDITFSSPTIDKLIRPVLEANNFLQSANNLHQLVEALGTGSFVAYLSDGEPKIDFVNATNIIPLAYDNDIIIDVLFWSKKKVKKGTEFYFNLHKLEDIEGKIEEGQATKEYVIYNVKKLVKKGSEQGTDIDLGDSAVIHTLSSRKKFGIDKTPEVNNIFINSPYGLSTYANATNIILSADRVYDTLDNEIKLGKKRVYIQAGASKFNTDTNGNITPVFDPDDIAFYLTPDEEGKELIKESDFKLRVEQLSTALQVQLNLLSKKVGLGVNGLRYENGEVYTNTTNIMSSNSDVYRRLKKQENITTTAIRDLIYGIADLLDITEDFDVSVFYDDSIIEDVKETRTQASLELSTNLISKRQYYKDVYKLGDKEAEEFAKQMAEERAEELALEPIEEEPEGEF